MSETPLPFHLRKIGHVVLNVTDLDASVRFYTELLGLDISDRYPDTMVPGGMVFLRCNTDHHGVALVGGARALDASSLNHFAFEVGTLDEVFRARAWLDKHGVPLVFEGRRRAGCQIAVEFRDPDGNNLEIYWNIDLAAFRSRSRIGQWDDRVEPRLIADHAGHVPLAGEVLCQHHVPWAHARHRAVPDLDLRGARQRDRILPSRGAVPVEHVPRRRHAERDRRGDLRRCGFAVRALGVYERLHRELHLGQVRFPVRPAVDSPDLRHGVRTLRAWRRHRRSLAARRMIANAVSSALTYPLSIDIISVRRWNP